MLIQLDNFEKSTFPSEFTPQFEFLFFSFSSPVNPARLAQLRALS